MKNLALIGFQAMGIPNHWYLRPSGHGAGGRIYDDFEKMNIIMVNLEQIGKS